jgi:DNA polymerase
VLCHHAHFDGLILSHHYGIKPRMWLDTMAMGRLLLGTHVSVSLDSLTRIFNLPAKTVPYKEMEGQQWEGMSVDLRQRIAQGAIHDVQLTWDIFCRLAPSFPAEEFALVDQTVRMFTEPVLVGNTARLAQLHSDEIQRKADLFAQLGVTGDQLRSVPKFCELLKAEGVEIENKPGKNGPIPAVAEDDDFMRDLCDDGRPRVATLALARLEASSSIVPTRLARLRSMSERGGMCVYLNYAGAHTSRFSGGDKLNWQNFPRTGTMGTAIEAPPGQVVIVCDASQIECRILNKFAGQEDIVDRFRKHEDIYIGIASQFYGEQIYKAKDDDPRKAEMDAKRGTGKQLELSCGYGAGGPKIVMTAKKGTYGPPVYLTEEQGLQARDLYRSTHQGVVSLWREAEDILRFLAAGGGCLWRQLLPIKDKCIYLPNGVPLIYETLEWIEDNSVWFGSWWITHRNQQGRVIKSKMYGAKLVENVIQALARVHTTQAWLRCAQAGMRIVSMEHDKLIAVSVDCGAEADLALMQHELCREPSWMPGIPLDSEGYISKTMKK